MKKILAAITVLLFFLQAFGQEPERVFSPAQGGAKKRIPAVAVTGRGTFLAATEQRPTTSDGSLTGIFIARRNPGGGWAYDTETLAYNAGGWGKFMNPSLPPAPTVPQAAYSCFSSPPPPHRVWR